MNGGQWPDSAPWWSLAILAAGLFIGWCAGGSVEIDRAQRRADLDRDLQAMAAYLAAGPDTDPDPPTTDPTP